MHRLPLLLLFIFSALMAESQMGYLFVKKGIKKKRIYLEGERIILQLNNDSIYTGLITHLRNDTIFINGQPVPKTRVKAVIIPRKKKTFNTSAQEILLITAGVALATAGLTLSEQAPFREALTAGLVIGYSPLLLRYLKTKISFKRKKFRIGKKFYLQVLEFHLPRNRAF